MQRRAGRPALWSATDLLQAQERTYPSVVSVPEGGGDLVIANAECKGTEEDAAELLA